jgi:myotubularin-related protein 5/13
MSFHKFIEERGPPFRSCDIFDEVYASIYEQLKRENEFCSTAVFEHIKELANQLLLNVKKKEFFGKFFYEIFL